LNAALPIDFAVERAAGIPTDVAGGLDRLATSAPLWSVDGTAWLGVVERVRTFACQWPASAAAIPLIVDTNADGRRGRNAPKPDSAAKIRELSNRVSLLSPSWGR